jgi:hypothetical protein
MYKLNVVNLLLVHRLLNPLGFVVFKMGRLRGERKEHPAPFYAAAYLVLPSVSKWCGT